ncbi:hypothetical protein PRIPAC_79402 [Pristionchus pacificus]|uniref:Uncharacterized protein n=1 Tax=Pristionchus pacificus TaxID=54126 RepID=A0A2A6CPZ7_PRIPA|nr:hypothetical protein PRIPAC_79402 [Pristionchus pacificus]|eukprot:PDM80111.1 hypothetical protein PRIPAC_32690 [Pristionchus pacificus]
MYSLIFVVFLNFRLANFYLISSRIFSFFNLIPLSLGNSIFRSIYRTHNVTFSRLSHISLITLSYLQSVRSTPLIPINTRPVALMVTAATVMTSSSLICVLLLISFVSLSFAQWGWGNNGWGNNGWGGNYWGNRWGGWGNNGWGSGWGHHHHHHHSHSHSHGK